MLSNDTYLIVPTRLRIIWRHGKIIDEDMQIGPPLLKDSKYGQASCVATGHSHKKFATPSLT